MNIDRIQLEAQRLAGVLGFSAAHALNITDETFQLIHQPSNQVAEAFSFTSEDDLINQIKERTSEITWSEKATDYIPLELETSD